ncbi:translation protein SH3-like domain-containing protein [Scheffersomyces xylosifermentans]|uniref:translation protein SH3-like domain-containing protein n=1 Tax=Scheffersomyces xylosifermentans TaxID=1304137 RepID=UPI00315DB1BE
MCNVLTIYIDTPTVFEPLPKKRNGENALSYLQKELLQRYDPTGKRRALVDSKTGLRAGDVIKVTYLDRTDVVGRVLGIKRGQNNVGTNILIRNKINRIGSEIRIPLFSPKLRNIEVLYKPEEYLSRGKQYYIRNTKLDVDDVEAYVKRQQHKLEKANVSKK